MKIAITTLKKNVSPRLDTADSLLIYEINAESVKKSKKVNLDAYPLYHIISILQQDEIEFIICGSCPLPFIRILNSLGVKVIFNSIKDPDSIAQKLIRGEIKKDLVSPKSISKKKKLFNGRY
jgi:predicted Fe-Mo cluster-binding NifX family protein